MNSGPRPRAQRWSRAIYAAYPELHGLWYASSMHTYTPVVALYERAEPILDALPRVNRPLGDPALRGALARIASELGYDLLGTINPAQRNSGSSRIMSEDNGTAVGRPANNVRSSRRR